ncbi:MAG: hypothetical protein U0441_12470 [Polyangiaceae bacterium]
MTAHRRRSVAAWLFAALGCGVLASSCIIPPEDVRGPCKADVDCADDGNPCTKEVCAADGFCDKKPQDLPAGDPGCDDKNPCTAESCSEGKCAYTAQDLPFGDPGCDDTNPCTDDVCQAGACAHTAASVPPSDGNDCTTDSCDNGVATHKPVADNTPCGKGGNLVCTGGECNCQTADECGTTTECQTFDCTMNVCSSTSKPLGSLVDNKDPGDCLKRVCDGMNNVVTVPDTTDPPPEIAGDCNKKACDANGNPTNVVDDTDKPADDMNACTTEGCNNGVPIDHTPVADGGACGNTTESCDAAPGGGYQYTAADKCVAGVCQAASPASCGLYKCNAAKCKAACSVDGDCIAGTFCDNATNACKPQADAGNPCQNNGQCSSGFCVDTVCCNSACVGLCQRCNDAGNNGLCIATLAGQDPDNECPGADACNGQGACAKQTGGTCSLDIECLSGVCSNGLCCDAVCTGPCNRCDLPGLNGTCSAISSGQTAQGCSGNQVCDGAGNCKTSTGNTCVSNSDCLSGFCQDGYCCNSACTGNCARCDIAGSVGTCTNVALGQQPQGCTGTQACDGQGGCKKINGQQCNQATDCASGFCPSENGNGNKYCCNAACTDQCKSCAGSKTVGQVNGVCDNIKDKTDPDAECSGAGCNTSNGNGCCVISGGMATCQ